MSNEQYMEIMERLDLIEFRQELLFNNSETDRSIFEYGLTRKQYKANPHSNASTIYFSALLRPYKFKSLISHVSELRLSAPYKN